MYEFHCEGPELRPTRERDFAEFWVLTPVYFADTFMHVYFSIEMLQIPPPPVSDQLSMCWVDWVDPWVGLG